MDGSLDKPKGKGTGEGGEEGDEKFQNERTSNIEDFLEGKFPGEFTRSVQTTGADAPQPPA